MMPGMHGATQLPLFVQNLRVSARFLDVLIITVARITFNIFKLQTFKILKTGVGVSNLTVCNVDFLKKTSFYLRFGSEYSLTRQIV